MSWHFTLEYLESNLNMVLNMQLFPGNFIFYFIIDWCLVVMATWGKLGQLHIWTSQVTERVAVVRFQVSATWADATVLHLTCRSKVLLPWVTFWGKDTEKQKNKWSLCLLFLLTSSSLRLMRFAIVAGNTVRSLSGRLSRWSNWQLNSCWWRERRDNSFYQKEHGWQIIYSVILDCLNVLTVLKV